MHPFGLRSLTWLPDDSFLVVGQDQHASQSVLHHLTAAPHVTGAEEEHLNLRYKRFQLWVRSESAFGLRRNCLSCILEAVGGLALGDLAVFLQENKTAHEAACT